MGHAEVGRCLCTKFLFKDFEVIIALFMNIADICGMVERGNLHSTVPLVSDGYVANYGEDPWHAAIYRVVTTDREPFLICGATIISSTTLLSGNIGTD